MLEVCPITLKEANAFVEQYHRHHKPVVGHKFSIGCTDGEKIVGVAIVGRPVSRYLDDGWTLEVNRLCTDGTKNACSMLYAAAWRAARAMGYHKLITYILENEKGEEVLQETAPIDIQQEIESYADECDIKNIVRKASFDPQFLKSLSEGALNDTFTDITEFPQNIHEYHKMIATAQVNIKKLEELQKKAATEPKAEPKAEPKTKEGEE